MDRSRLALFLLFLTFAIVSTKGYSKTIVIIGDSLTAGYGVDIKKAYPSLIEQKLKEKVQNFKVIPSAISGSTTASALRRVKWVTKGQVDLLVLALGGNDILRGIRPDSALKNLDESIEYAKDKGISVKLVEMKVPPNYGEKFGAEFNKIYGDLAKKHSIELIAFESFLGGVAGVKAMNQADGIHPNEKGHQLIADNLAPVLLQMIQNK
jgi:acyl-CoA thioesterase-1